MKKLDQIIEEQRKDFMRDVARLRNLEIPFTPIIRKTTWPPTHRWRAKIQVGNYVASSAPAISLEDAESLIGVQ